jgi:hypothetical protein
LLFAGVKLKFVPVIIMEAPMAPLPGLKLVIVGVGTVKFAELVPVIPLTVTEIGPLVAPKGTEVVILVVVDAVTTAAVPLNSTVFNEGVLLKLVPVMVTVAPVVPLLGVKLVMDGVPNTVKFEALLTVTPLNDTEIGPEPAPEGTDVVMLVVVKEVTTADVLLNSTIGVEMKFVPVIVTVTPIPAAVGLKLVIVGEASTSKFEPLETVTPLVITEIGPSDAPAGTVAVILVDELNVAVAVIPLKNLTVTGALKFVPVIVTAAPTAPLTGEKLVIVGEASTSKFEPLETVTPLVVTEIGPSAAPAGTVAVILVDELNVALAVIPLKNLTVTGALKFVPVIVTAAPTAPLTGEKPVNVGDGSTVKLEVLVIVIPLVVTVIFPVDVEGTIAVMLEADEEVTVALTPLKETKGEGPKFAPLMVTVAPIAPLEGVKGVELKVGVGNTEKLEPLLIVIPLTVTRIRPEFAPAGTLVAILDVVEDETTADVPLNVTTGVVSKFVPEIFTSVPTAPLNGVNPVIVGVGNTVKLETLAIVTPFTVIEIFPEVAPSGTDVVMLVVVNEVTAAGIPLNETEGDVLKFVPVIVTMASIAPLLGLKLVIVGADSTTKLFVLVTVTPLTVTEIFPEVAPDGTLAVMLLVVEAVTTAVVLLNLTTLSPGVVLKFAPEIMTLAPIAPLAGLKPEMDGDGKTVKLEELTMVTPLVVTEIVPEVAPKGTEVVIVVEEEEVTLAVVPLNNTVGEVVKLVPEIVTIAPTAPLAGVKPVIVGGGNTVKLEPLLTVTPFTVNEIKPVDAPTGTDVVMLLEVDAVTIAFTPPKVTALLDGVVLKLFPEIITVAPTAPAEGLNPEMDGEGNTVKSLALVTVTPLTVTEIFPVLEPPGTVVVMLLEVEAFITAVVLLNFTI